MIPKIIHYCWFGHAPMPGEYEENINEWRQLHADWEFKFWNNTNTNFDNAYLNKALENGNWANISNYVRIMVLEKFGGVYMDTDFKVIKPLDKLLNDACLLGFESGNEASDDFSVNNALTGCTPNHPFIQNCLQTLLEQFDGTEAANLSSPVLATTLLKEKYNLQVYGEQMLGDIKLYGKEVFYPLPFERAFDAKNLQQYITEKTFAVHLWGRSWYNKRELLERIDSQDRFIEDRIKYIQQLEECVNSATGEEITAQQLADYEAGSGRIEETVNSLNTKIFNQEIYIQSINQKVTNMESQLINEGNKNQNLIFDFLLNRINDLESKLNTVTINAAVAEKKIELENAYKQQDLATLTTTLQQVQEDQKQLMQMLETERAKAQEQVQQVQQEARATVDAARKDFQAVLEEVLMEMEKKAAQQEKHRRPQVENAPMPQKAEPKFESALTNEEKPLQVSAVDKEEDRKNKEMLEALMQEHKELQNLANRYKMEINARNEEIGRLNFKVNSLTSHIDNFPHVRAELEGRIRLLEELIQKMRLKNRAKRLLGLYKA